MRLENKVAMISGGARGMVFPLQSQKMVPALPVRVQDVASPSHMNSNRST